SFPAGRSSSSPPSLASGTPTAPPDGLRPDRKSTRLNSSHSQISYAVFCLKKKKRLQNARKSLNVTCWHWTSCRMLGQNVCGVFADHEEDDDGSSRYLAQTCQTSCKIFTAE